MKNLLCKVRRPTKLHFPNTVSFKKLQNKKTKYTPCGEEKKKNDWSHLK